MWLRRFANFFRTAPSPTRTPVSLYHTPLSARVSLRPRVPQMFASPSLHFPVLLLRLLLSSFFFPSFFLTVDSSTQPNCLGTSFCWGTSSSMCDTYTEEQSCHYHLACTWSSSCIPTTCSNFTSKDSCPASCQWTVTPSCITNDCSRFNASNECTLATGCAWSDDLGFCNLASTYFDPSLPCPFLAGTPDCAEYYYCDPSSKGPPLF